MRRCSTWARRSPTRSRSTSGGVYVVTVEALYRLSRRRDRPAAGRLAHGVRPRHQQKPGQLSRGSGTTPTLLPDGLVAITDNADPRMNVLFLRPRQRPEVCAAPVFEDDASATDNSLVAVGPAASWWRTTTATPVRSAPRSAAATAAGVARVDVVEGECEVTWTNADVSGADLGREGVAGDRTRLRLHQAPDLVGRQRVVPHRARHPHRPARLQRPHRHRHADEQPLRRHHPGPDGSAYIATLGGMVRVKDRE